MPNAYNFFNIQINFSKIKTNTKTNIRKNKKRSIVLKDFSDFWNFSIYWIFNFKSE